MLWDAYTENTKFKYFDYPSDNTVSSFLLPIKESESIFDLNSSHVKLDTPLYLSITFKDGDYYVEQEQLNLWSRNTDREKAITDITLQIVTLYCHLKKIGKDKLGPKAKQELQFLQEYIK